MKETVFLSDADQKVLRLCKDMKLSVSSVRYTPGHDADCMHANLKVGSKIVGTVWDDSWGGDFQYSGENVDKFLQALDAIIAKDYKVKAGKTEFGYNYDIIVDMLVKDLELSKEAKKKTLIYISKEPFDDSKFKYEQKILSFEYKSPYGTIPMEKVLKDFQEEIDQGYGYIEFVNKRFA